MEEIAPSLENDEKSGPPEVDEGTLRLMDQEAASEEIDLLRNMSVIEDYFNVDGTEMVLDTRQVHDWRFPESCWKGRCSLVAREFRFCVCPKKDLVIVEVPTWISRAFTNETHPQYWRASEVSQAKGKYCCNGMNMSK